MGGRCFIPHLVDIGLLPGKHVALSHYDLAYHDWICLVPGTSQGHLNVGRKTYHQGTGLGGLALAPEIRNGDTYTVIHYDQVSQYHYYVEIVNLADFLFSFFFERVLSQIADLQCLVHTISLSICSWMMTGLPGKARFSL